MADTRTTTIEETFGLIAVEEYGGKVRLWTEAELVVLARAEASYCRANGKGDSTSQPISGHAMGRRRSAFT